MPRGNELHPLKEAPDDWTPKDSTREWARKNAPDVDFWAEADAMKRHRFSTARTDWDKTLMNWLKRAQENVKPWQKSEPERTRSTWVPPEQKRKDRFDFAANKAFLAATQFYHGVPKYVCEEWVEQSQKMRGEWRVMEAEGLAPSDDECVLHLKKKFKSIMDMM